MAIRPALILIEKLCQKLETEGINYCHWKSNNALDRSANGDNDLDMLVERADAARFALILTELRFKRVFTITEKQITGVLDFYGYDEESGRLVHVHAQYLLVIGHDLTKNYRLPMEEPFLESATQGELFREPSPEFEFVVFVIRMNLKYSPWDVVLQSRREMKLSERQEFDYLLARCNKDRVNNIVIDYLSDVGVDLFEKCVQALGENYSTANRIKTGNQLQRSLNAFIRRPLFSNLFIKIRNRIVFGWRRRINMTALKHRMADGGIMIAIIGGDGSGKTTAVDGLYLWLSKEFRTMIKHMGKPRETLITRMVRGFLKIGTSLGLYPHLNSNNLNDLDPKTPNFKGKYPWMIREYFKARDRYITYAKMKRFSNRGGIVISDRFPISQIKLMDGPCCMQINNGAKIGWLTKFLVEREEKYYLLMTAPELMIVLRVNPDIAVARKTNEKPKDVLARSTEVWEIDWKDTQVKVVDASRSQIEVLSSLKSLIWDNIRVSSKNGPIIIKKAIIVEVIGIAGAGKTTLIKSLAQSNKYIYLVSKPQLRSVRNLLFVIRNAFSILPIVIGRSKHRGSFTLQKIWWMLFLNEVHTGLYEQRAKGNTLGLIDHGPFYMLTSLKIFGSDATRNRSFERWWNEKLRQWTSFIDIVVWLDAPNSVLVERINGRESEHPQKDVGEVEINIFLDRYRSAFEQLVDEIMINKLNLNILKYDSKRKSIEQIQSNILDAITRLGD